MFSQQLIDRFQSKTSLSDNGCIVWTAALSWDVYGAFWAFGAMRRAHRLAWEMANGPISKDLQVLHRCDNRVCINPEHLFLGTIIENMTDRDNKGRGLSGEDCSSAKLTVENIKEIRTSNLPATQLAKRYGVTHSTVSYVRRGDTWKDT